MLVSVGVGGLESTRTDFVPESDSDDDIDAPHGAADECVAGGLVEETQVYDDDDVCVLGSSSVLAADASLEQVIFFTNDSVQMTLFNVHTRSF